MADFQKYFERFVNPFFKVDQIDSPRNWVPFRASSPSKLLYDGAKVSLQKTFRLRPPKLDVIK